MSYEDIGIQMHRVTELFNDNPYSKEFKESNKYFFITINLELRIFIRKPKIYNSYLLFNKINKIPKLDGENKKYYYQIELPKIDYNCLLVQSNLNYYSYYSKYNLSSNDILLKYKYFYKDFLIGVSNYNFEILNNPYNSKKSQSLFINILNIDIDNYINFVPQNEYSINLLYDNNKIKL